MQLIALGFFILAAGVASSVQALVNSEVGRRTDPVTAATVSFMGGLAAGAAWAGPRSARQTPAPR